MSPITTGRVRKWVTVGIVCLLVVSLCAWLFQRETVPGRIRIASGSEQGMYFEVANSVEASLEDRTQRTVDVLVTDGSEDNFRLLMERKAELAIVQGGSVPIEETRVITPLFREFVFVIVRRELEAQSIWDLKDHCVCLGAPGSGNRDAALKVLHHFGMDQSDLSGPNDQPIEAFEHDDSIDAAIVTAGIGHPFLEKLLSTDDTEYQILPIRSAVALELVHPFVRNVEIPRGLFAAQPLVPSEPIPTIATTAYLVCRSDASSDLVQAALGTIHEESLRLEVPTLIKRNEATEWTVTRMHPTAQRYFNPEDNIGELASVMESLAATKELLFAFGAGIYLLWLRWRRLKEKELEELVHAQKERLDVFLMETLRIEKAQSTTNDANQLRGYIESVTQIKLRALKELTDEQLRGNQEFSIFLDQCSHLISRIQLSLLSHQDVKAEG